MIFEMFNTSLALQYPYEKKDYSSPKQVSGVLHKQADDAALAMIGYAIRSAGHPTMQWHGSVEQRLEQTVKNLDQKSMQTDKLAKQLETTTVGGKASSAHQKTRSQTRKNTPAPYPKRPQTRSQTKKVVAP
jgi:hypothetical protein